MIKLETNATKYPIMNIAIYFHNMDDCKRFLYVFKNHWCNVRWKEPIEIPDNTKISEYRRKDMDKDPEERAERDLKWGFGFAKMEGTDVTTIEQAAFVERMVNNICGN